MKSLFRFFCLAFWLGLLFSSCERNRTYEGTEGVLVFSADTLTFDTVFTTIGSVTRSIRIENPLNEDVVLDQVTLDGTYGNWFRINLDGQPGTSFENITIPANDYIYLFAEVHITGSNIPSTNDPFVIQDAIRYRYNGIEQVSYLRCWGQNAYFHYGEIYSGGTFTWAADKPHVVVRDAGFNGVGVEADATLVIDPGAQVYFYPNSAMIVAGELRAEGTAMDSIVLQSDRIEETNLDQSEVGGLWFGLLLLDGSRTTLAHTTIRQATFGLMARNAFSGSSEDLSNANNPVVELESCVIKHTSSGALVAVNAEVTANNCLFHSTDGSLVTLAVGGPYNFTHCTFAEQVSNGETYVVALSSALSTVVGGSAVFGPITQANFTNCIAYTSFGEGVFINEDNGAINTAWSHCLVSTEDSLNSSYTNCLFNRDPRFNNPEENAYAVDSASVALDYGAATMLLEDIRDNPRTLGAAPDLGAYERQP